MTDTTATLARLAELSAAIAATSAKNQKIARLADLLRALTPDQAALAALYLTGAAPQGKIGVGYALVSRALATAPATTPSLSLAEVDTALAAIAGARGVGSARSREATLGA